MGADPRGTAPTAPVIAGLILAAGRSSRMGRPKALLEIGGGVVIDRLLAVYARAGLAPVRVVASGALLQRACGIRGVEVVAGDPDQPMIDSLARGVEGLSGEVEGAIVQPVDAPFTTEAMIAALCDAPGSEHAARVLAHRGTPGHPVLIFRRIFPEIRARPEGGLRAILEQTEVERIEWPDPRILADLDTPDDLAHWEQEGLRPG